MMLFCSSFAESTPKESGDESSDGPDEEPAVGCQRDADAQEITPPTSAFGHFLTSALHSQDFQFTDKSLSAVFKQKQLRLKLLVGKDLKN